MEEANRKKLQEQSAAMNIRRVIQKFRYVRPDTLEATEQELQQMLAQHLEACGSLMEGVKQEAETAITSAREAQKQEAERKAEMEKKRQEAIETAGTLLKELKGMADAAEVASKVLLEKATPLTDKEAPELPVEKVESVADEVESVGVEAKEKAKVCSDFLLKNAATMKIMDTVPKKEDENEEDRITLTKLLTRINEMTKKNDLAMATSKHKKAAAVKKSEALKKVESQNKIFAKYNKSKDGFLNRKEIAAYAKGEYKFTLTDAHLDSICKVLVGEAKGVPKDKFFKLKCAVGVKREQAKDDIRKQERLKREAELAKKKEVLQKKVDAATKEVDEVKDKIAELEKAADVRKQKGASVADLQQFASETDDLVKVCKEIFAPARETVGKLSKDGKEEEVEQELLVFLSQQESLLEVRLKKMEAIITRAGQTAHNFRSEAKRKEMLEMRQIEQRALAMIRFHRQAKKLSLEALFEAVDSNKDGKVDEAEFKAFFETCEKQPLNKPKAEADAEKKEEDGEAKKEEEVKQEFMSAPSDDELSRLFKSLDEAGEGALPKDAFVSICRIYMKVVGETVITDGISIKEAKTLRRLDISEVLEILEGPVEEEAVKMERVKVKAMKDAVEGWVTVSGNQGTKFLKEGGHTFKVKAEILLTPAFLLDAAPESKEGEEAPKVPQPGRKLKVGELVEVREWPRAEEKSGATRMRCKVLADGSLGWVTTVNNAGTVFVEVV